MIEEGTRGLEVGIHIGKLSLHNLEFSDSLAELLAFIRVLAGEVESSLHQANRAS